MKYLAYIASLLLMLCSCSEDIQPEAGAGVPDGTPIEIEASAEFPDMNFGAESRVLTEQPVLADLKVNILVFDAAGVMQQYIPPEDIEFIKTEAGKVHFKVHNIFSSEQPRRLHFVISSADDITNSLKGGELITAMANETTVMPSLVSEGNTDVYWSLREVTSITPKTTLDLKVIRNFVKLSVKITDTTPEFVMTGYTVVNRPSKGTVAPYNYNNRTFASFLAEDNTTLKSYDDIIAQGYKGVNPAGVEQSMTHTSLEDVRNALANEGNDPCYFYERSQSDIAEAGAGAMETYIIVEGYYNGSHTYYKIDIGRDITGKFRFYDLLRNFEYTVQITEVGGPGASDLEAAMKGVAHNNLSSSVVMHDLFSISHDNEVIVVSDTRVIFTEKTEGFQLRFRYTVPPTSDSDNPFEASELKIYDLGVDKATEYDMAKYLNRTVDLSGEVIESASLSRDDTNNWYVLNITTKDIPTDARRFEQNLRIYYTGGNTNLGRSVTLMLRRPWELVEVTNSKAPAATASSDPKESDCDIKFKLPADLVSSQFPLVLTFESDKQNIYALKGSDLTVDVGKSGFKGATTDNVIRYEWSISYPTYVAKRDATKEEDKFYTAQFLMNTTSADDKTYVTSGIDGQTTEGENGNRESNNDTYKFCIRIANEGMKVIEPYYVNITRPAPDQKN